MAINPIGTGIQRVRLIRTFIFPSWVETTRGKKYTLKQAEKKEQKALREVWT
jgi:hypothetical protein